MSLSGLPVKMLRGLDLKPTHFLSLLGDIPFNAIGSVSGQFGIM